MGSPISLARLGWKRTTLKVDDVVTVEGTMARYKDNLANARSVVLGQYRPEAGCRLK
jgi:hypothetical protein